MVMQRFSLQLHCRTKQSFYLVFCCKVLYLNLSTLLSSSAEAIYSGYDLIFASAIRYFSRSAEPSTPSLKAADQPHFCYTIFLFTFLTKCVNGSKAVMNNSTQKGFIHFWQTLFWLLSLSGVCIGFGQPQRTLWHYLDWSAFVCVCVFNGWCL